MTEAITRTYTVHGMTCEHCAQSVSDEVGQLAGVDHVDVDLSSGRLALTGNPIADDAVRGAVEEAGYKLATNR